MTGKPQPCAPGETFHDWENIEYNNNKLVVKWRCTKCGKEYGYDKNKQRWTYLRIGT